MITIRTRDKVAVLAVTVAALGFYCDDRYLLGASCSAESGYAQFSQALKGQRFLRQQLAQVDAEIRRKLDEISSLEHLAQVSADEARQNQQLRSALYAKSPELRPTSAQAYAQQLRDTADAVERGAGLRRLVAQATQEAQAAAICRAKIQAQLDSRR